LRAAKSYESRSLAVQVDEVEKKLHRSDPKYGFLTYKCTDCDTTKTILLTCKSRICFLLHVCCEGVFCDDCLGCFVVDIFEDV
jgi:hypothetical protein